SQPSTAIAAISGAAITPLITSHTRRTDQGGACAGGDGGRLAVTLPSLEADINAESAPIAQRIDQQRERWRGLAAARVVEVVARVGRTPIGEHPDEPP